MYLVSCLIFQHTHTHMHTLTCTHTHTHTLYSAASKSASDAYNRMNEEQSEENLDTIT